MNQLLRNPSFEGSGHGEWTRKTHIGQEFGNWFTPMGWIGWWNPRKPRPEAHVIPFIPPFVGPPARVYDGHWACKLHKSFGAWEGGHYQIVDGLEVGATYEADFYAHAWCNHDGLPNAGDPDCAPMGCGPLYRLESELPPLSGDPVQDAWWAALFQVGVQSLGPGQNPDPTYNVVWGEAAAIYNAFAKVPTLTFEAEKGRIAYFIRCSFKWPYRNNDAYIDLARLEKVGTPPPQHQYERTYVLLPDYKPFRPEEQQRITVLNPGKSVGPSADDAAIGHPNLTKTTVISYKPQTWGGKTALEAFWREYYGFPRPQDVIEYREDDEPNPILLAQRDPKWAGVPLAYAGCTSTIGQQGCFVVDLAMAQRFYGIDAKATPVTVQQALGPQGFNGCVANWRGQPQLYKDALKLSVRFGSELDAIEHMDKGGCTMAEMLPTSLEHFLLIYQEGSGYVGLDPWANVERPFVLSEAQSWRILMHVEPSPTDTTPRISLHLQTMVPGVREFLQTARPASVKRVTGMQDLQTMKQWAPWIKTVYRHADNPDGALQFCDPQGQVTAESLRVAGDWLATYQDSLITVSTCGLWSADDPFYQEGPNEYGWAAGNLDSIKRAASFERSWIIKLAELGLPVAPVCFCAGVGNIGRPGQEEWDFLLLVDLAKETAAMGGGYGLHHYWTPGMLGQNWKYLAGRYQWIDRVLEENGVRGLKWFLGEGGIAGCVNNPTPLEMAGWKASCGNNGNWPVYLADILEWNRRTQEWNSTHGNRCETLNLFTTGIGVGWESFLLQTEQINALAGALS